MRVLAFESSCDETSVAVVVDGEVRANVVSSQIRLHAEYGGVVPELAAREHLLNLTRVAESAFREAELGPESMEGVAATLGPGLPQALMMGARAAQAFAFARELPFIGVQHHEAHLYSPWMSGHPARSEFEAMERHVSLIASGGHTMLVEVTRMGEHRVLGATLDDAAGECFDKVAKQLGLPYPGGPMVDRLAAEGIGARWAFPRPMLRDGTDDFSFSGLKTSVRHFLEKNPEAGADPAGLRDLCASVQAAIVEVLVGKLVQAAERLGLRCLTASGGVTCNRGFRTALTAAATRRGWRLRLASPELCTDNAGMVGLVGEWKLGRGERTELDDEIRPGWML